MAILAINVGSSSIKFALYPVNAAGIVAASDWSGEVQGLQPGGKATMQWKTAAGTVRQDLPGEGETAFTAALARIDQEVRQRGPLLAVAHRVVHGGQRFTDSVMITEAVLQELYTLVNLAPLHQGHNIQGIERFRQRFQKTPQIACFDTGFHAGHPEIERRWALPEAFFERGIARYGFHGLSYRFVVQTLQKKSAKAQGRLLLAHLGNGSSVCAVKDGISQTSSMGYSALDGLIMGTRCGSLDAGVILALLAEGWTATQLEDLLYRQSGLLGISGISADMRTLRQMSCESAQRAIAMYTYRLVRELGSSAAVLGGVDLLAFTGGIGEHDARLRQEVAEALAWMGIRLDAEANQRATGDSVQAIHHPDSLVELWVIPADEGRIAAQDAWNLLQRL